MHATQIIKKPLITEKSTWESESRNRYAFEVDRRATKPEIQAAIQAIYNVRVTKVRVQVRKGETFKNRYGVFQKPTWKKALVDLHEEDSIDLI